MYQLVSQVYDRQQGMLVIELRKRFSREMAFPLLIMGICVFIWLLFVPPLFLFAITFLVFYAYYSSRVRVILHYDAGALRVVRNCDFGFWQWRKQSLYNRADVPLPVYWTWVVQARKNGYLHLDDKKVRQYQMRFPFANEQNLGVICVCKAEWQMRQLQKAVDDFFAETPYNKSQYEQLETAVTPRQLSRTIPAKKQEKQQKKHIRDAHREARNRASRFDETKNYAFDRGEKPIRRGDEFFDKGELSPDLKLQQTHQKSYKLRHCSMVKVEEWRSREFQHGTLKLISTTGSLFSGIMAVISIFAYRLLILLVVLGGPALIYLHCTQGPKINRHVVPHLERLTAKFIAEDHRRPFDNAIQQYAEINSRQGEKFDIAGAIFFIWCSMIVFFIVLLRFVRWPFWGRWTVLIRHTGTYPHEILFSWQNDRSKSKEPVKNFQKFFRIIPATPKTNRLLTGRPFFTPNSGWRQPHQMVFITDEGSFALPCGSVDEQEQIIKRVRRLVNDVLGKDKE